MFQHSLTLIGAMIVISFALSANDTKAQNLPKQPDFTNHGVAVPTANGRTIVALEDADGSRIIFAWILRGAIIIDAQTGESEQYPIPISLSRNESPFHFLLTEDDKFYTLVGMGYTDVTVHDSQRMTRARHKMLGVAPCPFARYKMGDGQTLHRQGSRSDRP